MPSRIPKLILAGFLGALALTVSLAEAPAQPAQPVPGVAPIADGPEVLTRGAIHEAFAATGEQPAAGEMAPKEPPAPIEELPPDQKPDGDNVQWIPGYWDWDGERADFIWISGFWRQPPPNHVWVAGSWNAVPNGFQWTSGFWQLQTPNQAPEIEYLPPPPVPVEAGPTIPAPDAASVYVSGSWVWRNKYVWRPGFWVAHRPNWIWTPAHYRWTPLGYVFIEGFWDYPLATRGVLFTPVYFSRPIVVGYRYTPMYVVSEPVMYGSLFVRRGYGGYYYGDYYAVEYGRIGYQPWCAPAMRGVAVVPARGWHYDPLWSYYSVSYRSSPQWSTNVTTLYAGRYDGTYARPPHTLVQQNQVILKAANVTNVNNVTNNITVVNNNMTVNNTNVSQHVMVAPLALTPKLQPQTKLSPISAQVRQTEAKHATDLQAMAVVRQKSEADAVKARPPVAVVQPGMPPPAPPAPVKIKVEVPKTVAVRSQVHEEVKQPPVHPVHPMLDHKVEVPKVVPMPPVVPKFDPKITPMPPVVPKIDPKITPMLPVVPKFEPKITPKVDPKPVPKVDPKSPPGKEPPK